tara:strand:- start:8123 stop:8959 length:837 start_codon:yes stop_codon:yes gene_type:complete
MKEKKNDEFFITFQSEGQRHFNQLYFVNKKEFIKGCGSYLFNGNEYIYDKTMYEKQKLLFELCKTNNKVLEIGSYMGHSILIMLLANPKIQITAIDSNHIFSKPSLEYLQEQFPESKITFIHNDSLKALSNLKEKFDLFHVDGSHRHEIISKEFLSLFNLIEGNKMSVLFDDVITMQHLKNNILKNFEIIKNLSPNSNAPNLYVEIKLDRKLIEENIKNFKLENFKIFLKYRLVKILTRKTVRNKIIRNRITIKLWNLFFEDFVVFRKFREKLFQYIS